MDKDKVRLKTKYGMQEYTIQKFNSKSDFMKMIRSFWKVLGETAEKEAIIIFEDGSKQECKRFFYCIDGYMPRNSVYECFHYNDIFLSVFAFSTFQSVFEDYPVT